MFPIPHPLDCYCEKSASLILEILKLSQSCLRQNFVKIQTPVAITAIWKAQIPWFSQYFLVVKVLVSRLLSLRIPGAGHYLAEVCSAVPKTTILNKFPKISPEETNAVKSSLFKISVRYCILHHLSKCCLRKEAEVVQFPTLSEGIHLLGE